MSQLKMASSTGDYCKLGCELEGKLRLQDGAAIVPPEKCSGGAAPQKLVERRPVDEVGDYRERFVRAYERLRDELISDDSCELTDEARRWVAQMIDYNVPGGKLNRGAKLENFSRLRDILIEMGVYCQAQNDYLDCFADPNTIGKIGTDIEDHKCSWLIVEALGHADRKQIENYYGKKDSASVSKVKSTYSALDLKDIFSEFENRAYKHLVSSIEAQHDRAVQEILKSFPKKIHRRKR